MDTLRENVQADLNDLLNEDTIRSKEGRIWADLGVRKNAVDTFYQSFGLCLNMRTEGFKNELEMIMPICVLVDNDGYYISYNGSLDGVNSNVGFDYEDLHTMTSLNAWAKDFGDYTVRFFLDDTIVLTDKKTGGQYNGKREELVIEDPAEEIAFLFDKEEFEEYKNEVIVQEINDKVLYYINNVNFAADMYDTQYALNLPESKGQDWCGLISRPTVIGFTQGKSYSVRGRKLSVYGYGMSDLGEQVTYFIYEDADGYKTYHCLEMEEHNGNIEKIDQKFYYKGEEITDFYQTIEECARKGAFQDYRS